ncbi:MAG: alpha-hydroxy-acid oxidizing protein [Acidiferrobacterales bacterium]|nr:alpha-hydroxy-acid oxidizing protein [Acidiferrobacterales bacterium]
MLTAIYSVEDARRIARLKMPKLVFDYIDGAAGDEGANLRNQRSLNQIKLLPRVLVNVDEKQLTKKCLNHQWGLPFGIAPMGMCNLAHPKGDRLLAQAATRLNIPHCLSTMSSSSIEDVGKWANGNAWFQLYMGQSEEQAMSLVERARKAGYQNLILTVDVPEVAPRRRDMRNGFKSPLKIGPRQFLDFALHPLWSIPTLVAGAPSLGNFAEGEFDRDAKRGLADWHFLDRLRTEWQGKLIVKGVLSPEDAVRIRDAGVDGIYVSNHGGRQLGSAPAAIEQLPKIRKAVGDELCLIFDSGVRDGEGVVKALAMGADFVMLGRSLSYGMGANGEEGLNQVLDLIINEIQLTLAQLGCADIEQIGPQMLVE